MRVQHILFATFIALLAAPAVATDLYVSQFRGCGLITLCSPGLAFYRVDLERQVITPLSNGPYTTIAGFDATQPRAFVRATVDDFPCCRVTWVDLTGNPQAPSGTLYPSFTSSIFDSGRLFAIQGVDLFELDAATGAPTPVMSLTLPAEPLALDVARGRLYIAARPGNSQARDLRVVDLARKTVSGPIMQIRQYATVVVDRDGSAYVFDGPWRFFGLTDVFRLDAAANELTPFAGGVLIETQHLVLDPVDRRVYGTFAGNVVSFDLVTKTTRVAVPKPQATIEWYSVAGVVHKAPARTRAIR